MYKLKQYYDCHGMSKSSIGLNVFLLFLFDIQMIIKNLSSRNICWEDLFHTFLKKFPKKSAFVIFSFGISLTLKNIGKDVVYL